MTKTFVLRSFTRDLPVDLTPDEMRDRGERMAQLAGDIDQHDLHAQQVKADLKAARTALEAEMSKLGLAIRRKQEVRPVQCHEEAVPTDGVVVTRRLDTNELVSGPGSTRPLRDDERQQTIFEPDSDEPREVNPRPPRIRRAPALPPPEDGDAA
jgi:hypothetical protein